MSAFSLIVKYMSISMCVDFVSLYIVVDFLYRNEKYSLEKILKIITISAYIRINKTNLINHYPRIVVLRTGITVGTQDFCVK